MSCLLLFRMNTPPQVAVKIGAEGRHNQRRFSFALLEVKNSTIRCLQIKIYVFPFKPCMPSLSNLGPSMRSTCTTMHANSSRSAMPCRSRDAQLHKTKN